jgi:hypothetical protein
VPTSGSDSATVRLLIDVINDLAFTGSGVLVALLTANDPRMRDLPVYAPACIVSNTAADNELRFDTSRR